jgi:hypothetical protein
MAKASTVSTATNSNARKEAARKAGKCQLCGEKTTGFSAVINYDKGTVSVVKAKPGHAFYCKDHAEQKRKRYQWKLARKATSSTTGRGSRKQAKRSNGKATAKPATAKPARKRTAKATAKPKATKAPKATAKRKVVKKSAAKAKASSAADPF